MVALTAKQKAFVAEYLIDLNATQATLRAGYVTKNADKVGAQLLGKDWVQAAIQAARKPYCEYCGGRWCLQIHHLIYICGRCRAKVHSGEISKEAELSR